MTIRIADAPYACRVAWLLLAGPPQPSARGGVAVQEGAEMASPLRTTASLALAGLGRQMIVPSSFLDVVSDVGFVKYFLNHFK